jgi:hypothetical protein
VSDTSSAFYVAADSSHFIGLVALINSLRVVGHDEPIYVANCGFAGSQARRLAEHVILVETDGASTPHVAKTVAPLTHPADVMVLLDADIIVTRPLTQLIDTARPGRVVAFVDRVAHRFDARWSELLGLGPLRRQQYANSGMLVTEREIGLNLLDRVADGCKRIEIGRTIVANGNPLYPFYYLDQDVLNALLATYPIEAIELLDHRLAPFPPFAGVRIVHEELLRCSYDDGVEPFALHHTARKPWISATRWSVYSQLLSRVVLGDDVALRLSRKEVPLRLQRGRIAWLEKRRSDLLGTIHGQRGRLGLRRRLADHVGRRGMAKRESGRRS